MYTVYQHRNLKNGKSYIGMTSQNPKARWNNGKGYKNNLRMWSDIQNSDWNTDWVHEILGQFEDKQEALNIEEMFIGLFDSTNNGYNISSYGNSHYERTEEQKRKMSEANTGKHFSEEHRKKISEALSGEKAYWYGKHHSEESKRKMSESKTSEKNYWYGKHLSEETRRKISESKGVNGVLQFSKDGELIAEYSSIHEAERHTGCNHGNISKCCKGKLKSAGGYIWRYKEILKILKNNA